MFAGSNPSEITCVFMVYKYLRIKIINIDLDFVEGGFEGNLKTCELKNIWSPEQIIICGHA